MDSPVKSAVVATPNVTPMIDVMLVLLIIFMVVAPALISGIVVEPPEAANLRDHPEDPADHTLALDARGAYYLDKKPIESQVLGSAIAALYPPSSLDRVLYLRAHKDLAYATVLEAMDIARKNGVTVVGMISERKNP
jgi:biopolymer transport protein TolR